MRAPPDAVKMMHGHAAAARLFEEQRDAFAGDRAHRPAAKIEVHHAERDRKAVDRREPADDDFGEPAFSRSRAQLCRIGASCRPSPADRPAERPARSRRSRRRRASRCGRTRACGSGSRSACRRRDSPPGRCGRAPRRTSGTCSTARRRSAAASSSLRERSQSGIGISALPLGLARSRHEPAPHRAGRAAGDS